MLLREIQASIPVEIWHQCWELTQHTELEVLSRTCHLFRDICLPLLFAGLSHKPITYNAHGLYWELSSVTMLRYSMNINRIAASSKLAALPRRWQVSDIGGFKTVPAVFDDSYKLVDVCRGLYFESISRGLSAFTSLRAIEFRSIVVGEDILRALNKLPALEVLTCLWTRLPCYSVTLLRVRVLTLFSDSVVPIENSLDIVSNKTIERLALNSPSFPAILQRPSNQPYHHLSDLSLFDGYLDIPTLFKFLRLCPQLRRLNISTTNNSAGAVGVDSTPLPTSIIPHLKTFSGRGYLATMIIPGRPVETVSIQRREWIDEGIVMILKSISQSTLPIRGLRLPSMLTDVMVISLIREYFPYLKSLRLAFSAHFPYMCSVVYSGSPLESTEMEWDESGTSPYKAYHYAGLMKLLCLGKMSLPSGIQEIDISSGTEVVTAFQSQTYLAKLSVLYPSLTIVVLGNNHWIKNSNGNWESIKRQDSRLSHFLREW